MLLVVKMDKGATDILLLVIGFYANGDPPLKTMRTANLASSDPHVLFIFQEVEERIPS